MASIQTPSTPSPTPNPSAPLPPNVERRRRLRQEKQRERLIQAWRLLVFAGSSTALAWVLLSSGWNLRSIDQVRVSGSDRVGPESVVEAGGLRFPLPLLSLQPGNLERRLMDELPVQSVSIHRRLLPPGLEIKLLDRRPIAAATRNAAGGIERGMVDREGFWMPMTAALAEETPESDVRVQGVDSESSLNNRKTARETGSAWQPSANGSCGSRWRSQCAHGISRPCETRV